MRTRTYLVFALPLLGVVSAQATPVSLPARWGQASALVGSLFVVQGGKTQGTTGGGYTYGSAPSDGQMYALDLSASFSLSSPPWQSVAVQADSLAAPPVCFHTISPLNSTSLLLFGGDGSPVVPVQTGNDSAYIVHLSNTNSNRTVSYQTAPTTWNQPMRRIYHTSESNSRGSVWIVGGEKADGSGLVFDQQWSIDSTASSPTFQLASPSPPGSLVGSTSTLLSDGTLLLLGGADASGSLQSFQNLYAYSTNSRTWTQTPTKASSSQALSARQADSTSNFPMPRRNHIAVSLPNQRVLIQGGASEDLSTVYSDAWILDWSVDPPVWSELDATGGPGPRFGHAAVAYGSQVLISFGWAGGNAAPTGVHVFDSSTLTASTSTEGSWTGGSWSSTTYTPNLPASQPGSSSTPSSGTSSADGNGSSSSSGGNAATSSDSNNGNGSDPSSAPSPSFPTGSVAPSSDGTANTNSNSGSGGSDGGTKAGAAIGALLGAGLVVGGGYAAYRKRSLNNYRRYGNASAGILGFGGRAGDGGPSDDDYLMEKGYAQSEYDRPYHRSDGGAAFTGGLAYGRKRGRNEGSPWTAGNVGHAMEGSGPHFRERIAIIAGRGKRDTVIAPRVDMLADEGDGHSLFPSYDAERASHLYDNDEEEADDLLWNQRRLREHSYAHVGDHEQDLSSGDIGHFQHEDERPEHDMYSPFEDRPEEAGTGRMMFSSSSRGYGKLADRELDGHDNYDRRSYDEGRSDFDSHDGPSTEPSLQSHSTASKSDAPRSSQSTDAVSASHIVSFSDASHGRRTGSQTTMKRSPTWWDRFMGVERSISGRFLSGPQASLPIRDPAAPPPVSGLQPITESPRSRDVSEAQNPFADSELGLDEMGRRVGTDGEYISNHPQGQSVSSIGSARTAASSHFESRVRGMDVVQRVRTGSSRRTQSTTRTGSTMSDTDSEPALSRGNTLLRPRNVASSEVLGEESVQDDLGHGRGLEDLPEEEHNDLSASAASLSPYPMGDGRAGVRKSNVSETPSITPLTTKRARQNPLMVSPLFPSPTTSFPQRAAPPSNAVGSVKDRVKAIESQSATTLDSSTSVWTASLSSVRSTRTLSKDTADTSINPGAAESIARTVSPSSTATGSRGKKGKAYLVHGMVPKAQLFVANPDGRSRGEGSS